MFAFQGRPAKRLVTGVEISTTSYREVVACCERWLHERRSGLVLPARYICVTSVHGIITAQDDAEFRKILNSADVVTPDGMPLVWALRSLGAKNQERVYGPDLMLRICESAVVKGFRVFLYGSHEDCLEKLRLRLHETFPDLRIVGWWAPPFRPLTSDEENWVVSRITSSEAEIIFVGISTPKQERWMYRHRECFPGAVMIGVGAAFDFHAGRVRQAPRWIQRNGLEWLFRLLMDPVRLWRRYLLVTPRFLPLWAIQRFFGRAS